MVLEGADAASRILDDWAPAFLSLSLSLSVGLPFSLSLSLSPPSLSLSLSLCAFAASYALGPGVSPGEDPRPLSVVKQVQ